MFDTALKKKVEELEATARHLLKVAGEIREMAGINESKRKPVSNVRAAVMVKMEKHLINNKKAALGTN